MMEQENAAPDWKRFSVVAVSRTGTGYVFENVSSLEFDDGFLRVTANGRESAFDLGKFGTVMAFWSNPHGMARTASSTNGFDEPDSRAKSGTGRDR